jgi:hypothetical protein
MSVARGHDQSARQVKRQVRRAGYGVLLLAACGFCGVAACTSSTAVNAPPATARVTEAAPANASTKTEAANFSGQAPAGTDRLSALDRGTDAFASVVKLSGGRQFAKQTIERHSTKKRFSLVVGYPQLTGDDSPAAQNFNRAALSLVNRDIQPYLKDRRDLEKEKHPHWKDVEEYHNISHKVIFATDEVISVLFYADGYSWGAAHGYHYPFALNYDLKRGRVLNLTDLFKPNSRPLQTIERYCLEDLSRQLNRTPEQIQEWSGRTKPKPENYRAWVLTPNGLVIIFEEYQVTSYAGGEPKVLLAYSRLKDIIDPRGVLASPATNG